MIKSAIPFFLTNLTYLNVKLRPNSVSLRISSKRPPPPLFFQTCIRHLIINYSVDFGVTSNIDFYMYFM